MNRFSHTVLTMMLAGMLALPHPGLAYAVTTHTTDTPDAVEPGALMIWFGDDTMDTGDFADLARAGAPPSDVRVVRPEVAVVEDVEPAAMESLAAAIRASSTAVIVAPVGTVRALETVPPSDPSYGATTVKQRTYLGPRALFPHAIGLETVWDATLNSESFALNRHRSGVTVALIDTGVSPSLMEDTGEYVPIWDYANDDPAPDDDSGSASTPFHGTRVASIIRARTDNGYGIAGALHRSANRVLVYKTLDGSGAGENIDTMTAMMDAADRGVRIINLSLGERATTLSFGAVADRETRAAWQAAVDYCTSRGALVVAASGNEGTSSYPAVYYPAACDGALAVGAIDPTTGTRASFSSYGPELDVVAPGVDIWTVGPNDSRVLSKGTSFATPVVSGALAYLWSLVPGRTPGQMVSLVTRTADGSYGPAAGFDSQTGFGLFDAEAAYAEMTATIPVQAPVSVKASKPNGFETTLTWTAASGAGVFYRYGSYDGPEYQTTSTSGRLPLTHSGSNAVYVQSFAQDRWGAQRDATATVTVTADLPDLDSSRLEGPDRYETAASLSQAAFPGTASAVVIASGENWPDGLSATSFAAAVKGPLLTTRADRLSIPARDEIVRLRPRTIYIAGGSQAVSDVVEDALRSLPLRATVTRLAGRDRYDTARIIAQRTAQIAGGPIERVIIASGENYPDAVSIGPLAAAGGYPVLLACSSGLPSSTREALAVLQPNATIVAGGTRAVSTAVASTLPSPTRLGGTDRYDTSRKIAAYGVSAGILDSGSLGFATGTNFPDALGAGPALGPSRTPVLLTDGPTKQMNDWLVPRALKVRRVTLIGGSSTVTYETEFSLKATLRTP
jgi:cell wall-associated protease